MMQVEHSLRERRGEERRNAGWRWYCYLDNGKHPETPASGVYPYYSAQRLRPDLVPQPQVVDEGEEKADGHQHSIQIALSPLHVSFCPHPPPLCRFCFNEGMCLQRRPMEQMQVNVATLPHHRDVIVMADSSKISQDRSLPSKHASEKKPSNALFCLSRNALQLFSLLSSPHQITRVGHYFCNSSFSFL